MGNPPVSNPYNTLGNAGCAVTSIGNLHNAAFGTSYTPHDVNQLLMNNGGFVYSRDGYALLYWAKVQAAFPKLQFVYKDPIYSNPTVWAWINVTQHMPVIVETQLQYSTHFVVFLGNQLMVDSQDGKVKTTNTYKNYIASVRYKKA
jgi:hypothetical protein